MTDAAEQVQTPVVGAVLGGRFRIVRRIGEGGMGVVLEAENTLTGKRVAIKWMHPQMAAQAGAAERMVREARASARVRHPNVVDVYDVVQEAGAIFLVMELLEGEPLTALLDRPGIEPHVIIRHLLDAMRGVAAAHREGVIHRDIKPDNIFLAREPDRAAPIPKVLDFGISKLTDRDGGGLSLTRTGMTLGTPLYMSYEQLAGVRDIDGRTDVYAFGVILYEALTGQPPFNAETFSELIIKITTTLPPAPKTLRPSLPSALSSIVENAMKRDREERTPSLDALVSALEPFSSREGYAARVTSLGEAPIRAHAPTSARTEPGTPSTGNEAVLTGGRVAVTSVRTLDNLSDPDTPRISSIPRSFTARSALLWGAVAVAVAASAFWLVSQRRVEPEAAAPDASDAPAVTPPSGEPSPATVAATDERAAEEPTPAAEQPTAATPAAATAKPATAAPAAAARTPVPRAPHATRTEASRPARTKPRETTVTQPAPAAPAQEPRPRPSAPQPRAGRPQSAEF